MKPGVIIALVIGIAVIAVIGGGVAGFLIGRAQFANAEVFTRVYTFDGGSDLFGREIFMGRWRDGITPFRMGPGMMEMWVWEDDQPRLRYMLDAYAEALDMTTEELQDKLKSGKSLWDLASAKGIPSEDFDEFMINAATQALNKMVADDEITQKQADTILERMKENWQNVNPETCPCFDGFGGRGRMWRWAVP